MKPYALDYEGRSPRDSADMLPPHPPHPRNDAFSQATREMQVPADLLARLRDEQAGPESTIEEASSAAPTVEELGDEDPYRDDDGQPRRASLTIRKRRREDLETLDRENPFVKPSPLAPWQPTPARREESDSVSLLKHYWPREVANKDRKGAGLEMVIVVWTVLIAVVAVAQHFVH